MAYIKRDTPYFDTANAFLVYIVGNDPVCVASPSIHTRSGISSVEFNGSDSYKDETTGLKISLSSTDPELAVKLEYEEPASGRVSGSSTINVKVTSKGSDEYTQESAVFTFGLVCCVDMVDPFHAGNTVIPVSGVEHTIGTGKYTPVKDITQNGTNGGVSFVASNSTFIGTPNTPGAYVGVVNGSSEIAPGVYVSGKRPLNIAVKDTRLYTDQEHVVVIPDPSTATTNRNCIKIHHISDADAGIPFVENPGNGFYITPPSNYFDANINSHSYTMARDYSGSEQIMDVTGCPYYSAGLCMHGQSCLYSTFSTITDSRWSVRHNGNTVATATSAYNSTVAPSSGWSGAVVTGEGELHYNGNTYAYASSYASVMFAPVEGKCTGLVPHTLNFYKVKEYYSKSLDGWGSYGGSGHTGTPEYITEDTDTGLFVEGLCTSTIIEGDGKTILKGVTKLAGAGFITNPITAHISDFAVSIGGHGIGVGFGDGTSEYGLAVQDAILPTYDWAQLYADRPRTTMMLPYEGVHTVTSNISNTPVASRIYLYEYVYKESSSRPIDRYERRDVSPYKLFRKQSSYIPEWVYKGFTSTYEEKLGIYIKETVNNTSGDAKLPYYIASGDSPSVFYNVVDASVSTTKSFDMQALEKGTSVHLAVEAAEYILYDDILYKSVDSKFKPLDCRSLNRKSPTFTRTEGDTTFNVYSVHKWEAVVPYHFTYLDASTSTIISGMGMPVKAPVVDSHGRVKKYGRSYNSIKLPEDDRRLDLSRVYENVTIHICEEHEVIPPDPDTLLGRDIKFSKLSIWIKFNDYDYISIDEGDIRNIDPEALVRRCNVTGSYTLDEANKVTSPNGASSPSPHSVLVRCNTDSDCEHQECFAWQIYGYCCSHHKYVSVSYQHMDAFTIDATYGPIMRTNDSDPTNPNVGTGMCTYIPGIDTSCYDDDQSCDNEPCAVVCSAWVADTIGHLDELVEEYDKSYSNTLGVGILDTSFSRSDSCFPAIQLSVSLRNSTDNRCFSRQGMFTNNEYNYNSCTNIGTVLGPAFTGDGLAALMVYYPIGDGTYRARPWHAKDSITHKRTFQGVKSSEFSAVFDGETLKGSNALSYDINTIITNTLMDFRPDGLLGLYIPTGNIIESCGVTAAKSLSTGYGEFGSSADYCDIVEDIKIEITYDGSYSGDGTVDEPIYCIVECGTATIFDVSSTMSATYEKPDDLDYIPHMTILSSLYPFEAPDVSTRKYRSIQASGKQFIVGIADPAFNTINHTVSGNYEYRDSSNSGCRCYDYSSSSSVLNESWPEPCAIEIMGTEYGHCDGVPIYIDTQITSTQPSTISYDDVRSGATVKLLGDHTASNSSYICYNVDKNIEAGIEWWGIPACPPASGLHMMTMATPSSEELGHYTEYHMAWTDHPCRLGDRREDVSSSFMSGKGGLYYTTDMTTYVKVNGGDGTLQDLIPECGDGLTMVHSIYKSRFYGWANDAGDVLVAYCANEWPDEYYEYKHPVYNINVRHLYTNIDRWGIEESVNLLRFAAALVNSGGDDSHSTSDCRTSGSTHFHYYIRPVNSMDAVTAIDYIIRLLGQSEVPVPCHGAEDYLLIEELERGGYLYDNVIHITPDIS